MPVYYGNTPVNSIFLGGVSVSPKYNGIDLINLIPVVFTVTSQTELNSAIAAPGSNKDIRVVAGPNYSLDLTGNTSHSKCKISSNDSNNKATFTKTWFRSSNNFEVNGIQYAGGTLRHAYAENCTNIKILNCVSNGGATQFYDGTNTKGVDFFEGRGNTGLELGNNSGTGNGFIFKLTGAPNTQYNTNIHDNTFSLYQFDGLDWFCRVVGLQFDRNILYNRLGSNYEGNVNGFTGNHPDFVQGSTSGTTEPSSNIRIRDNTLVSLRGAFSQGIFNNDEAHLNPGYLDYEVTGNVVITDSFHGITLRSIDGGKIANNLVLMDEFASHTDDPTYAADGSDNTKPFILISPTSSGNFPTDVKNVIVQNNVSEAYSGLSTPGVTASNNTTLVRENTDTEFSLIRWFPQYQSWTSIDQILALKLPVGFGPIRLQDPNYSLPPIGNPNGLTNDSGSNLTTDAGTLLTTGA